MRLRRKKNKCPKRESNTRPPDLQSGALPTELFRLAQFQVKVLNKNIIEKKTKLHIEFSY